MVDNELASLQNKLVLQEKELTLLKTIDHIRDTVPQPIAMLTAIVDLLVAQLDCNLCLLCLCNRETGKPELKIVNSRRSELDHLQDLLVHHLTEQVITLDDVTIWRGIDILPNQPPDSEIASLQMAGIPIILNSEGRLGALLLVRSNQPFSQNEVSLLQTAEDQIDSAVIQGYVSHDMQLHVKELETVYRVDHIRDKNLPFEQMLNAVLQELQFTIEAEMGFVMLYDLKGTQLEMRASTHADLFELPQYYNIVTQVAQESLEAAELICRNALDKTIRSIMCLPLILNDRIIGVLGVINGYGNRNFSTDDRRLLCAIGSQMDTAIFESIEKRRLRQVLGRSIDPRVMDSLLANPGVDFLKGERSTLSVLYADLRGSTQLAEQIEPELLVGFINDYLTKMTEVIFAHEGTLDKFVGDEVMALFGAPFPQPDHALRAVEAGLAMQKAHQLVMQTWQQQGLPLTPIGVGVATGELIVGEIGCAQRADYTVLGRAANLGARICSAAKGGQVLVSPATFDLVKGKVEAVPVTGQQFKGVEHELTVYHVSRILD